jgi:hypothetical protein
MLILPCALLLIALTLGADHAADACTYPRLVAIAQILSTRARDQGPDGDPA